jgi:predicted nucleotidyltransferase
MDMARGTFAELDEPSTAYVRQVTRRLEDVLGADLVGVYLHGSGTLGGFTAQGSDVDLITVSSRKLTRSHKATLAKTSPIRHSPARRGISSFM